MARQWDMQPSEFWQLTIAEFWWEYDSKAKSHKRLKKGLGGFSEAEWEDARKRFAEQEGKR